MHAPSFLRDAHWLRKDRVSAIGQILLLCWAVLMASIPWTAPDMQLAHDFAAFWTASGFALAGRLADAYGALGSAAVGAVLGPGIHAPFYYPPTAMLVWLPFALLPFAAAAAVWLAGSAVAYAVVLRRIAGGNLALLAAFPSVIVCGLYGQNTLFSAALLGGAVLTLDRRPILAGMLLGCLCYKPQLAILVPLTLLLARRWYALVSAALTVATLVVASAVAFGIGPWLAFIGNLDAASAWFSRGSPGYDKFVSPFAALRLVGLSSALAWAVQASAAALALSWLVWVLRRARCGQAELAAMVVALAFCVPSLGEYELVILALPAAWVAAEAMRSDWLPYERLALGVLYLAPIIIKVAALDGVPLAPAALVALAVLVTRRIRPARCGA